MKRILSLVLSLALLLGSIPMVISAAAPTDFQTNFAINYQDDQWTNAGGQACDTVQVDYQLQGTGLSGTQGAWIAVDLTKLTWVHNTKNGETIFDKLTLERGADSVQLSNQNFYTLKKTVTDEDSGEDVDAWTPTLKLICAVALSADGKTLYIGTYPMQVYNVTYNDLTTVMSFRFAVLPGAQLETDSIRYINEVERAALNQSYIFAMNDGRKGYYYRSTTEPDTLSAIPFTGNAGITGLPTVHAATPVITQAPAGADYYLDAVAAPLSVVATVSDGGTLSYAWYKNATNSNVGGELVSTAATCPITTTAISDAYYYVVVTNTNNLVNGNKTASVTSAPVRVTVSKDPDITALENAKAILDAAPAIPVSQKDYPMANDVRNYIHTELSKLVSGVVLTVNDVAYTASVPGTSANPTGTAGSYTYTVTIAKNGKSLTTVQRTSPVAAVWYDGVTDEQAAQIAYEKLLGATWNSLLQKNAETKADAIAALTQQATAIVGNATATITVSVADSGFLPAVAGSAATSHAGTPGSVAFDVTVTVGAHSHTVSGKSVVITATPYAGQLNSEALTVATNALNAIEWANIAQTVANTEAEVIDIIEALAKAAIADANKNAIDPVPVDVTVTIAENGFTAAVAGSASVGHNGVAGSVKFTVTATVVGTPYTTAEKTFNITATEYKGQLNSEALTVATNALNAIEWANIAQTVANTEAEVTALIEALAKAAIAEANANFTDPVPVDVTVTIAENGFTAAVAGSASVGHNGTAGSVKFTVTATVAGTPYTTAEKTFDITATEYKGQLNSEALTVATNALNAIEWANIAQTTANTEADVTALIETLAKAAIAEANANFTDPVPVDVTVTIAENGFTAAVAGSASVGHNGTAGSVKFTVTATVAGTPYTTAVKTFNITATEYKGQLNSEALTVATNALNAIEWANIAQTTANTEADVTALIETLAKAAIADANKNAIDPVPVDVTVTIAENGFTAAVAGSASVGHNGTAGIVKFTVTATVAGTPYTTAEKTFNITATEYKGQLNSEALTVATNALNAIEWADIAQTVANTEAEVTALIEALAKAAIADANKNAIDPVPVDVTVTIAENGFTAAQAGSASIGHNGIAGSVKFTVTATVAGTPYTTAEKTFNITATEYKGQLNSEALTVATNALNAIEWADIAQTTANTEEDVIALIEALAKAAIADANKNAIDPVPVTVGVTVTEFNPAVAGSASIGHNGIAGIVKFTVTATVAGTPYTTAEKTFNITATEYKGQLNSEALTVATNALNAIEWADIAQTTANTEATVIAKITAIANAAIAEANKDTVTPVPVTVTVTVAENGFTAAVAGSSSTKREGDNGSVKFTVTATVAGTPYTTAEKTFDIIATYYNGVMDEDAVDAGQEALENLTETTVTVKIGATAAEILEYVKAHLQSFMKGDATGVTVSVTAGADGQYTATLTKGTESAQITLTLTVEEEDPIKLEAPENLYFSGGVASWSEVDHAVSYTVNLYLVSGSNLEIVQTENITSTRISFFDIMEEGLSYVYDVTVHGDGIYYVDSDVSVHSGVYTKNTALTPEQAMLILMMLKSTRADITATAGEGGSISEDGVKTVRRGTNVTYRITADEGYVIDTVIVDGQAIGAVSEYTFQNVQKDHTIVAVFKAAKWQNPFTDVNELNSYYDAVRFVYELGLFEGVSKTEFAPTVSMTRAMFVTVLWRLEGMPVVNYAMQFSDVEENTWYTEAIRWAAAEGIVEGYGDGIYGTNDSVTVEQAAVIMARYAQYAGKYTPGYADLNAFADQADVADWAAEAMQWSVSNGIYLGEAGYLQPKAEAPRSLAAEWMYEYTVRFGK